MSQWILYNTAMAYAIKKLKFARTIENYLTCYHYIIVNASCIIKTYPTNFAFGVVIDDVMITVMTK
jgi:hypothetical protein